MPQSNSEARNAVLAAAMCYGIWGLVPLVFQAMGKAGPGPWEIMTHRVVWGALSAALMVAAARQGPELMRVLKSPRTLLMLTLSATLIAVNWVLFIWAVNSGRTLETSLGYYITPLINMAAGALIFRERIGRIGQAAIALAAAGVAPLAQPDR